MGVAPLWLWIAFTVGIITLLTLDLLLFNKKAHEIKLKEAIGFSIFWVLIALAFNWWFATQYGTELGIQFLSGYIIEESLSVDNLFVMLIIFQAFNIPAKFQHRVLFWGILGAIISRGIFIIFGAALVNSFHWILYLFGAILIYTAFKLVKETTSKGIQDEKFDVTHHWAVKLLNKLFPVVKNNNDEHFFVRINNKLHITPLFIALIVIEVSDIVFAIDSIPAVFSITNDAFVAFASNILAVLGLRSLYFVIAASVSKIRYLKQGLALILGFVGTKMLIVKFYKFSDVQSLFVIISILVVVSVASWNQNRREERLKQ